MSAGCQFCAVTEEDRTWLGIALQMFHRQLGQHGTMQVQKRGNGLPLIWQIRRQLAAGCDLGGGRKVEDIRS